MPDLKPDYLIVRYLSREASPAEQEKLFEWVSRNKENQRVFNEYVTIWSNTNKPGSIFNVEKATRQLNARIEDFEATENKKTVFRNGWSLAAAILLLMVSGFVLFSTGLFNEPEQRQAWKEIRTADSTLRITLPDGSIITLNKQSSLTYPETFAAATREVRLIHGEAFFEVAKDPAQPFIIQTKDMTTTVVGTSFNILSTTDAVVVSVATGKVKVSNGVQTADVLPNERVIYRTQNLRKEPTDLAELDWLNRTLIFDDTPLEEAARKIEKYFEVKVSFKQETLKRCQITGKFKNKSLETVLKAIAFSNDVKYEIVQDTVILSGPGCK